MIIDCCTPEFENCTDVIIENENSDIVLDFDIRKELLDWFEENSISYSIAIPIEKDQLNSEYWVWTFDGFLLDFENKNDELLFKLTFG